MIPWWAVQDLEHVLKGMASTHLLIVVVLCNQKRGCDFQTLFCVAKSSKPPRSKSDQLVDHVQRGARESSPHLQHIQEATATAAWTAKLGVARWNKRSYD